MPSIKVGDGMIESGQWEVPGFADGVYLSLAVGGRIMWEEAIMESTKEPEKEPEKPDMKPADQKEDMAKFLEMIRM